MEPNWWDQKKQEWLYKREISRMQREARKFGKLQAKEQARIEREIAGGAPTLAQRHERWAQERAVKKELQAEFWRQLQEQHPLLGWLKRHETLVFSLLSIGLVLIFCVFIAVEARKSDRLAREKELQKRIMATINGKPIYLETVVDRIFYAHGASMLQELSEQEVIRQEAAKYHLELTGDDLKIIDRLLSKDPRPNVSEPRLETAFLVRKLILRSVTEERKKEVYKDFKEELACYQVTSLSFLNRTRTENFLQDIKAGKPFEQATLDHCLGGKPASTGVFTPPVLEGLYGKIAGRAVRKLKPGQMTQPFNKDGKYFIYLLDSISTEYDSDKVQEAIETLIVEAETPQFLYDAIARSKIESRFIDPDTSDFQKDTPGPSEPEKSPTPNAAATPISP